MYGNIDLPFTVPFDPQDILDWLAKDAKHLSCNDERIATEDTGTWLFDHNKFRGWLDKAGSSTIWLEGKPGKAVTYPHIAACSSKPFNDNMS